jgi:hypothetical protein
MLWTTDFLISIFCTTIAGVHLLGCSQVRDSNQVCFIGASADRGLVHVAQTQSILFIEERGTLYAKLLQCGGKEYYLGAYESSSSHAALGEEFFESIKSAQWDGFLSCSDAISAYPYNHKNTTELLTKLCAVSEKGNSP